MTKTREHPSWSCEGSSEVQELVHVQALPLPSCLTLGPSFKLSMLQCPHLCWSGFDTLVSLTDLGKDCFSQGSLVPKDSKQLIWEPAFHMQTNQFWICIPNHPLYLTPTPGQYFPCPNPRARQLETTAIAQIPLKLFKFANPKVFTLPSLPFLWKPQ